jgi:hypothetical protein
MTTKHPQRDRLFHRYAHVGCPGAQMEDVCARPDDCADAGCCQMIERAEMVRDENYESCNV